MLLLVSGFPGNESNWVRVVTVLIFYRDLLFSVFFNSMWECFSCIYYVYF